MTKKKLVFATGNQGKVNEFKQMLGEQYDIYSMKDLGLDIEIVEDGKTFEENAILKAEAVMKATGEMVLADDSGLEIDCLGGEPGVYSARYLGEETPFTVKSQDFLRRLAGVADKERTARFVCAIAAVWPDGETAVTLGTIEGRIGHRRFVRFAQCGPATGVPFQGHERNLRPHFHDLLAEVSLSSIK